MQNYVSQLWLCTFELNGSFTSREILIHLDCIYISVFAPEAYVVSVFCGEFFQTSTFYI